MSLSLEDFRRAYLALPSPFFACIELTRKCNERCVHCYISDYSDYGLSTQEVFCLLDDMKSLGVFFIIFTGGEVTLRDDWRNIVQYARKLHFMVCVFTNGATLTEDDVRFLKNIYVHNVEVSLYSHNPDVHDDITKLKGSFARTVKTIELCVKYKVDITIKSPIFKNNYSSYRHIIEYAESLGIKYLVSPIISAKNNRDKSTFDLRLDDNELDNVLGYPGVSKQGTGVFQGDFNDSIACKAVYNTLFVDCEGYVYPCNQFLYSIGSIKESNIINIWFQSEKLKEFRMIRGSDLKDCHKCDLLNYCRRCPGMAYFEDNNLYGCSSTGKQIASSQKRCGILIDDRDYWYQVCDCLRGD